MFGFWSNKSLKSTLEDLVGAFKELKEELKEALKPKEELKVVDEGVKISIFYQPAVELSVFINGDKIFSNDLSFETYNKLLKLKEEKDVAGIYKLLVPEDEKPREVREQEKIVEKQEKVIEEIVEKVHYLVGTGDFEVKGDSVHLKDVNRTIPKFMVDRFMELHLDDRLEEYEALKNFWNWIVTNPNARATEEFYKQVDKYKPTITKEGFILAYRWVKSVPKTKVNTKLVEFISREWARIKKAKKGVNNFSVYEHPKDGLQLLKTTVTNANVDFDGQGGTVHGKLGDLYAKIGEMQPEQTYTDGYTGTMDIRIGKEVNMPRTECDESTADCSKGLHACFNLADHSSNGDVKLLVAICPRNIVSAPYNSSKFRSCAYLPLAVLGKNETDKDYFAKGEGLNMLEDYFDFKVEELKKLEEEAKTKTVKELTEQRLMPERIQTVEQVQKEVEVVVKNLTAVDTSTRVQTIS